MKLEAKIEAILFTSARAFSFKRLAELCEVDATEIKSAAQVLHDRLEKTESALQLATHGQEIELVTRPEVAEVVRATIKDETQGELTRPSLEALAVLAYRGPMTRPELEQIRGVQCSMILRNLMMRGLVEMREDSRLGQPLYSVTLDFLKHLGADRVESLPDFESLHTNSTVEQALAELQESSSPSIETKIQV